MSTEVPAGSNGPEAADLEETKKGEVIVGGGSSGDSVTASAVRISPGKSNQSI